MDSYEEESLPVFWITDLRQFILELCISDWSQLRFLTYNNGKIIIRCWNLTTHTIRLRTETTWAKKISPFKLKVNNIFRSIIIKRVYFKKKTWFSLYVNVYLAWQWIQIRQWKQRKKKKKQQEERSALFRNIKNK